MVARIVRCLIPVLAAVTASSALAAIPTYEAEILDRVAARYRELKSFHLTGTLLVETPAKDRTQRMAARLVMAAVRPGRIREELQDPLHGFIQVSDGSHTWVYLAGNRQYSKAPGPGPDIGDPESGGGAGLRTSVAGRILANYRGIDLTAESAQTLPAQYLALGGRERECVVIEVTYQSSVMGAVKTFWIDREELVVLRHRIRTPVMDPPGAEHVETVTYDRVDIDVPVPDSVFVFTPPAGAKELPGGASRAPHRTDLVGKPAANFTLADLSGKRRALAAERGKVVVLDFWASWCGPCRASMPLVDALYREHRDKGLVVFAINQRESAKVAGEYMRREQYSTTALLDTDGAIGDLYSVEGIPTLVVIDRKGTIASYLVGHRPQAELRAALAAAGLR